MLNRSYGRMPRVLLTGAATLSLVLTCGLSSAQAPSATPDPGNAGLIYVNATGSIPGMKANELAPFVAATMNAAKTGRWRFEPVPEDEAASGDRPPNRIEWSFSFNPGASGAVRTFGFSQAQIERLVGVHRFVSIEVRLFLDGQYQTESFGQATVTNKAHDPHLTAEVEQLTRSLTDSQTVRSQTDGRGDAKEPKIPS